jgi:hypothetical protein
MLRPIEPEQFPEHLYASTLDDSPVRGMGGTPVVLLCREVLRRGRELVIFSLDPATEFERVFEGERLKIYFGSHTTKGAANPAESHRG